ncbi:aldo/keto reductase [Agromyces larvae]|uniref:Aldo/keto reductase n=1 Tax=Agromyces larvae TaxID=2929802 RepID=A0ABY4BZZ3_9MICO|nr:aldo/keto reductase [Agromyces larvae]UOE44733.1 aldo/keto reductase [Agromyces larvae]
MARHLGSRVQAATVIETTFIERGAAPIERAEPLSSETRTSAAPTRSVETNLLSGPITVPSPVALGDTGSELHPLGLGGSLFGWTLGTDDSERVLDRFVGSGGSLIDTADSYAAGRSESIIGRWMASRHVRDRVLIATKAGRGAEHPGLRPEAIVAAVDASLERLRTDRIDLLMFHGDDPATPLEESLGAVGALIDAGKVRALGAADFPPDRLIEARVLAANGLPRLQALTAEYSLMRRRGFEGATELVAHAQGLAVLPYFALANGFLGGNVRRRSEAPRDARGARIAAHLGRRGHRVLTALDDIAFRHGCEPATVALAWLLTRPTVVAPIVGVSRPEQVGALLAAASLPLARSEIVELDRASA